MDQHTRHTVIGVSLASAIIIAWAAIHIFGVHFFTFSLRTLPLALPLMAIQAWLSVGLFIISHDAIHGSLAPGRPKINRLFGRLAVTLYAGFSFEQLREAHTQHHKHPGTEHDPDFSVEHPSSPLPWFREFFLRYFGWRPLIFVNTVVASYWLLLGASMVNIFCFYGLPALGSACQLFYFGTYLPHRHVTEPQIFADRHHARSSPFSWWISLLTCFHFGYHHEHHLYPHEPWWRLPACRTYSDPVARKTG